MSKTIELDEKDLELGFEIVREISEFRPYSSISFRLSEKILDAIKEVRKLAMWGMAKNRHNMKHAVDDILSSILHNSPGEPANLNLTKYERKSIKSVVNLINRVLKKRKDGVVLK